MSHSQKAKGLVCGLSTRKTRDAVADPELDHGPQRLPQLRPVGSVEVERDRCPRSAWAGSRRSGSSRRAGGANHSGCSTTHGWSGEHWKARSRATSMPAVAGGGDQPVEVVDRPQVGVDGGVTAVAAGRWPRGCPGRRARRSAPRPGPCGWSPRSGGSAAGRARRSPSGPRTSRRHTAPARVPGTSGATADRGKNSYQAPKRDRSRSTRTRQIGRGGDRPGRPVPSHQPGQSRRLEKLEQ